MHTEVMSYPAHDSFVKAQRSLIDICDNDFAQGFVLSYLIGWTNSNVQSAKQDKLEDLALVNDGEIPLRRRGMWIYRTRKQMVDDMHGAFGERALRGALEALIAKGFIRTRKNPKHGWDRTDQYLVEINVVQGYLDGLKYSIEEEAEPNCSDATLHGAQKHLGRCSKAASKVPKSSSNTLDIEEEIEEEILGEGNPQKSSSKNFPTESFPSQKTSGEAQKFVKRERQYTKAVEGKGSPTKNPPNEMIEWFCDLDGIEWTDVIDTRFWIEDSSSLLSTRTWTKESFRSLYRFVSKKFPYSDNEGRRDHTKEIKLRKLIDYYPQWSANHKPKPVEKTVKVVTTPTPVDEVEEKIYYSPMQLREGETVIDRNKRLLLLMQENRRKAKESWKP